MLFLEISMGKKGNKTKQLYVISVCFRNKIATGVGNVFPDLPNTSELDVICFRS